MATASAVQLEQTTAAGLEHLRSICEFSVIPPMRAKIDRQSYDELKPVVERTFALVDWFDRLQQSFAGFVGELKTAGGSPSPEQLALLAQALDACIVIENQFGGWSNCINRFSWFKRTFAAVRHEVVAEDPTAEQLTRDMSRIQTLIGTPAYPIGMHLTGPLRETTKRVAGHEEILLSVLFHYTSIASSAPPPPAVLRPLPYLLYLADGDSSGASGFSVFTAKLQPVQKVFKKYPLADCGPPQELVAELGLQPGHPVHLGTVLARCPNYMPSMRSRWGMQNNGGDAGGIKCAVL